MTLAPSDLSCMVSINLSKVMQQVSSWNWRGIVLRMHSAECTCQFKFLDY